jgi:hypothetical protein
MANIVNVSYSEENGAEGGLLLLLEEELWEPSKEAIAPGMNVVAGFCGVLLGAELLVAALAFVVVAVLSDFWEVAQEEEDEEGRGGSIFRSPSSRDSCCSCNLSAELPLMERNFTVIREKRSKAEAEVGGGEGV